MSPTSTTRFDNRRRWFLLPGICLFLTAMIPSSVDAANQSLRDVEVSIQLRRALSEDEKLQSWRVIVLLRQGKAILRGELPDSELIEHALNVAKNVQGVLEVENQLRILTTPTPWHPEDTRALDVVEGFVPSMPWYHSKEELWAKDKLPIHLAARERYHVSPLRRRSPDATVSLKPPVVEARDQRQETREDLLTGPKREPGKNQELINSLAQLQTSDQRYRSLRMSVSDGVVLIEGRVINGKVLHALAKQVAKTKGVKRVRVRNVEFIN